MKFPCRRCGQRLEAPEGAAGQSFPCPNCGEPVVVPPAVIGAGFAPRLPAAPLAVRRGGGFAAIVKLLLLGLLIAAGAFAYAMRAGHESAPQVWQRWQAVARAKLRGILALATPVAPSPVAATVAPTPHPLPTAGATPTAAVAQTTPAPEAPATPAPVASVAPPPVSATSDGDVDRPQPQPGFERRRATRSTRWSSAARTRKRNTRSPPRIAPCFRTSWSSTDRVVKSGTTRTR